VASSEKGGKILHATLIGGIETFIHDLSLTRIISGIDFTKALDNIYTWIQLPNATMGE